MAERNDKSGKPTSGTHGEGQVAGERKQEGAQGKRSTTERDGDRERDPKEFPGRGTQSTRPDTTQGTTARRENRENDGGDRNQDVEGRTGTTTGKGSDQRTRGGVGPTDGGMGSRGSTNTGKERDEDQLDTDREEEENDARRTQARQGDKKSGPQGSGTTGTRGNH